MAVYTEVAFEEARKLIAQLNIGELTELNPCSGGIENTNYFATTTQGEYVLTLWEGDARVVARYGFRTVRR